MLAQLPDHTIAKPLHTYEHLDILWGENVHKDVIPEVLDALEYHCGEHDDAVSDNVKTTDALVMD